MVMVMVFTGQVLPHHKLAQPLERSGKTECQVFYFSSSAKNNIHTATLQPLSQIKVETKDEQTESCGTWVSHCGWPTQHRTILRYKWTADIPQLFGHWLGARDQSWQKLKSNKIMQALIPNLCAWWNFEFICSLFDRLWCFDRIFTMEKLLMKWNEIGRNFSGWRVGEWQAAYLGLLPCWSLKLNHS